MADALPSELVPFMSLKPHPRNYKHHPPEQIEHLIQSIKEHGFYRNVIVARDNTILAGHGVVQAVERMGLLGPQLVPVVRIDVEPDDPRALKILLADNEIGNLAEINDRALTEMARDVMTAADLLGTGLDVQQLTARVMVSRPIEEVRDKNESAEWVGMPEFDAGSVQLHRLVVMFATTDDRDEFVKQTGIRPSDRNRDGTQWSGWWPPRGKMDRINVLFTDDQGELFE